FSFRLPLALLALALSGLIAVAPKTGTAHRFDVAGAALLVAWMSALLLAVAILPGSFGLVVPGLLAGAALVGFVAFLRREADHPQSLIRLSLFRNPDFVIFNAASIAVNLAAFSVLILVPYFLVRVAAFDLATGGVVLALGAGGGVIGAWCTGKLANHAGVGWLAFGGIAVNVAGLAPISTWTAATPPAVVGPSQLVQGFGLGVFTVSYTDYVTHTLPIADRGVAGSLTMVTPT